MRRNVLVVALSFACGFASCWLYRDRESDRPGDSPHFLTKEFHVQRADHKGKPATIYALRPYAISVGGRREQLRPQPVDEQAVQIWTISFDGGRTWVYAEEAE